MTGVLPWTVAAVAAVAAGYVQGLTGLGFAIVFTPVVVLVVPQPHQVVVASLLLGAVLSAAVLVEGRKSFRPGRASPLLVGAAIGTPVGVALLPHLPRTILTVVIAVTALLAATVWVIRIPEPVRRETPLVAAAGLLGGLLNGTTSMGGPPPALAVTMQRWPVAESRSALVTFNLLSYAIAVVVAVTTGIVDVGFLLRCLWLLPAAAVGTILGSWSARRISARGFKYALAVVVYLAGVLALVSVFT